MDTQTSSNEYGQIPPSTNKITKTKNITEPSPSTSHSTFTMANLQSQLKEGFESWIFQEIRRFYIYQRRDIYGDEKLYNSFDILFYYLVFLQELLQSLYSNELFYCN